MVPLTNRARDLALDTPNSLRFLWQVIIVSDGSFAISKVLETASLVAKLVYLLRFVHNSSLLLSLFFVWPFQTISCS